MTWKEVDSPGVYRACVPRPPDEDMAEVVTGGVIDDKADMTITTCLENCNEMVRMYSDATLRFNILWKVLDLNQSGLHSITRIATIKKS